MNESEKAVATAASTVQVESKPAQSTEEKPRTSTGDLPPEALAQRLERERTKAAADARAELLKSAGLADEEELKAVAAQRQAQIEAEKTQAEKLADLTKKHETTAQRAARVEAVLKERCAAEIKGLSEEQLAAVKKLAGDDDVQMLAAIDVLKPTWAKAPKAEHDGDSGGKSQEEKAPAVVPDTAPTRAAPKETKAAPVDHKATWLAMKETDAFAAARYFQSHKAAIFPSQ